MKKIGIDARFFGSSGKGLGRYTQKLLESLEKIDFENQYFVFLRKENYDEYKPHNKNFKKVVADYRWYGFSEQILFPILLLRHKLDLVHFPHFNVPVLYYRKIVVTIHDLILLHFPTVKNTTLSPLSYWLKFLAYKVTIFMAIKRAKIIIAVSEFTKKDVIRNYGLNEDKVCVTYEACNSFCFFRGGTGNEILKKYGIMKPYFLYVGNAYPHKNLELLVESFSEASEKLRGIELVLVGKEDYFYERLKKFTLENRVKNVVFAGFVPDEELDEIYRNTIAYVFPSLYEGFGLPPLEAMSKGVPVISSNHECMREILEEGALFFNATIKKEIILAMEKVAQNDGIRKDFSKKGFEILAKYSWEKMAKETLSIYRKIY